MYIIPIRKLYRSGYRDMLAIPTELALLYDTLLARRAVLTDPDSSGRAPTDAFAGSPLLCWLLRAAVLQPGFQSAAPCGVQACRKLGVVEITAHGLRHSAATILLNHVEKYAIVLRGSLSESASHPNQPYSGK
jgi:hypothetical protein